MPPPAASPHVTLPPQPGGSRRGFLVRFAAIVIGGLLALFPLLAGLVVLFDPWRRKSANRDAVRVATLTQVPDDGVPRQFRVVVPERDDAWTRHVNEPVGAVYLVRNKGEKTVLALQATCPHAGCFVSYLAAKKHFGCPCHKSTFDTSGHRTDAATSPSPRDMDALVCEVRGQEVWVAYQDFHIATPEKKPKA